MPIKRHHITLLLIFLFTACTSAAPEPIDDTPPQLDCTPAESSQVIETGWEFRLDPDDEGIDEQWYDPTQDNGNWDEFAPGMAWENTGVAAYADYDGLAWYRTTVDVSDWEENYLTISRVDDAARLWVNSEETAAIQLSESRAAVIDLSKWATDSETVDVAFRVRDDGVYGGIMDPVRLAATPTAGLTPDQWIATRSDNNPDWPMPTWINGEKLAWTLTGGIGSEDESLVSIDGLIAPLPEMPTVEAWLYDPASNTLESGIGRIEFSLVNGNLPMPQWSWHAENAFVQNTLLHDHTDNALRWRLQIENTTQKHLLIAVRPFAVNRSASPITAVSMVDPSRMWLDRRPYMIAGERPDAGGVGTLTAVMDAALAGNTPEDNQINCLPEGNGAALMRYTLNPGITELDFAFALNSDSFPSMDVDGAARLDDEITRWQQATTRTIFYVPDERIAESVPASIGYLLLANDPDGPHPGSLAHDAVWVRDAAYTGRALLQTGHAETVRGYMDAIFAGQEENGRVPPIQGESIPWDDDEWDSQGQAIYLTVQYYRYTDDQETLEQWYPNIKLAAEFLVALLEANANADDAAIRGILPPSLSAEDLGPGDRHYYWDNFWAIAGLEEAAYAAALLGHAEDAVWMQQTADDLREAVLASIEAVMGNEPAFIPASVEDTTTSAMARGTTPALWPYRVFDPEMPLLQRAFAHYFAEWVEPYGGAYLHREGQFWPYGGIELAHVYLRLGQSGPLHTILGWSLSNQTLPNTYAWAEQISPANGGFTGGDMPHAWAAGSWTTLIREMLASEWDDRLHVFTGVPTWWFEGERVVGLENAPTHFGTLNLRTSGILTAAENGWSGELTLSVNGATPPGGFHWQMPYEPTHIDGTTDTQLVNGVLIIPPEGGEFILTFGQG